MGWELVVCMHNSAFRWIYDKESNTCNLCPCSSFPAPRQLRAAAVHQKPPELWDPWLGHGRGAMKRLRTELVPGFATQRTPGAGEKENAWNKTKALFVQGVPAFSRKTHVKLTINLTRRNMEHHKAEEWAQRLLTCSAPWYMEAELDWNFNSSCNSPQIIITSYIKMKVLHIISAPRAERIWMRLSY